MKYLLIIFLACCLEVVFAQQLSYKGELVDTILVTSLNSVYHFDKHGTTTGRVDSFMVVYNKDYSCYKATYSRTHFTSVLSLDSFFMDRTMVRGNLKIDIDKVSCLLSQLETGSIKPDAKTLDIDSNTLSRLANKNRILKIARRIKHAWKFAPAYSWPEENRTFFRACASIDSLNRYLALSIKFDTTYGYIMVTDYSDNYNLYITTTNNSCRFEGKYPNVFRQPWYNFCDKKEAFPAKLFNLNINRALAALLPKKFQNNSSLNTQSLIDKYIEWYLEEY